MREHLIKNLCKHSCVHGKQKTWIPELNDDQLYEIFFRLRNNEPAKSIARHVQNNIHVQSQSSIHSISQGVLKFKYRISRLLITPHADSFSTSESYSDDLNDIEGMEYISRLQLNRIRSLMAEEESTGIKHPALSREIHALTALNKAITKAKELEIKNGSADPVINRKFKRKKAVIESKFNSLMDKLGPDGRDRMIIATEKILKLAEENALTVEVNSDGEYSFVDPDD